MHIKPTSRADWYHWLDPDIDWCRANAEQPGLRFEMFHGKLVVFYHISHVPTLPDEAQCAHNLIEQQASIPLPFEVNNTLRGYQQADLQFLKQRRGALLAYEMRLGKTPLAVHLHNPNDGILVVCGPLAAREAWREWIERVTGAPPYLLYGRGNVESELGYHAYFVHYDVLDAHTPFLITQRIGTLVLDEFHILQSRGTQKASATNAVLVRASKILGLTGTPCWNKPKSMWNLLHTLTPGAWGSQFEFRKRYAGAVPGAHGWLYEGISHAEELQARLKTIMVRRTWKEVMPELPPTTRVVEPVALSGATYVAIEAATMKARLARGRVTQAGYLATLRRKLAEIKIKPARDIAVQALDNGHNPVLWVWHNEIGEKVAAAFPSNVTVLRLQSTDPAPKRESIVRAFRAAPVGTCALVAAMGVAGVGLDLSHSDYAIFVELDWTPAVVQQAEMRTFHVSRPHVVVYLHADDSVETALINALDVKHSFAAALGLDTDAIMQKVLS
jgi:SNF2 family DNA or RNA helicase